MRRRRWWWSTTGGRGSSGRRRRHLVALRKRSGVRMARAALCVRTCERRDHADMCSARIRCLGLASVTVDAQICEPMIAMPSARSIDGTSDTVMTCAALSALGCTLRFSARHDRIYRESAGREGSEKTNRAARHAGGVCSERAHPTQRSHAIEQIDIPRVSEMSIRNRTPTAARATLLSQGLEGSVERKLCRNMNGYRSGPPPLTKLWQAATLTDPDFTDSGRRRTLGGAHARRVADAAGGSKPPTRLPSSRIDLVWRSTREKRRPLDARLHWRTDAAEVRAQVVEGIRFASVLA